MTVVQITVNDIVYAFYKKVGECAGGLAPERVMSDALYRLAGELSLDALQGEKKK